SFLLLSLWVLPLPVLRVLSLRILSLWLLPLRLWIRWLSRRWLSRRWLSRRSVIHTIDLFTKAVPDTPTSWLDKFISGWLAQAINCVSIDGVSGKWNAEGDPRIRACSKTLRLGSHFFFI